MAGIYVHIPFCQRKCSYCDFFSVGAKNAPWGRLVDAILAELSERLPEIASEKVSTIYIGGGTPSLLPPDQLRRLALALRRTAPEAEEFTIELNPDDVTPALVSLLCECGINRASMGVQSFVDEELKSVGRRHSADRALQAYHLLRPIGNVSIDLIFGLPGQTLQSWQYTLKQAIALRPEHISAYSLMWEPGTPLTLLRDQGRVSELPEELCIQMYRLMTEQLTAAGYLHYEVSSYCMPARHSRHNSSYWSGAPYLGLGPAAHSYDGLRTRRANPADIPAYLNRFAPQSPNSAPLPPFFTQENLSYEELREEYLLTRLRTAAGIPLADYSARFGPAALTRLLQKARPHLRSAHLRLTPTPLSITPALTPNPNSTPLTPTSPNLTPNTTLTLDPAAFLLLDPILLDLL